MCMSVGICTYTIHTCIYKWMDLWRWAGTDNVDHESETLSPSQPMITGNFPWNTRALQFGVKHASGPGESGGTQKWPDPIPQNPKPKSNQNKTKKERKKKERKQTKTKGGTGHLDWPVLKSPVIGEEQYHGCDSMEATVNPNKRVLNRMAAGRPDCRQQGEKVSWGTCVQQQPALQRWYGAHHKLKQPWPSSHKGPERKQGDHSTWVTLDLKNFRGWVGHLDSI